MPAAEHHRRFTVLKKWLAAHVVLKSIPIYQVNILMDGTVQEKIEVTGSIFHFLSTVSRPKRRLLKQNYEHARDKQFYLMEIGEYQTHLILGDKTYSRIQNKKAFRILDG